MSGATIAVDVLFVSTGVQFVDCLRPLTIFVPPLIVVFTSTLQARDPMRSQATEVCWQVKFAWVDVSLART